MTHSDDFREWHGNDTGETLPVGEPLEVIVVNEVRVQEFPAKNLTTGQAPFGLANVPVNVVPGRPGRVSIRIKNRTSAEVTVWIGGSDQLTAGTGTQLDPGEWLSFEMDGPLWAKCDTNYGGADVPGGERAGRIDWSAINRDGA